MLTWIRNKGKYAGWEKEDMKICGLGEEIKENMPVGGRTGKLADCEKKGRKINRLGEEGRQENMLEKKVGRRKNFGRRKTGKLTN